MIPTIETCFHIMDQHGMLENIWAHSLVVARVARLITRDLVASGLHLSMNMVTAGALMHDIGKTRSLDSGEDHAALGRNICLENGFGEIADIVGEHVVLKDREPVDRFSEKEIVYYADKRVNHDRIVNLNDRMEYILKRYGQNRASLCLRIRKNFKLCKRVEEKLFKRVSFRPESLFLLVEGEEIIEAGSLYRRNEG
jgi:uncharacterized protein